MSDYPEHEKLDKVKDESNAIGAFLDVGLPEQGLVVCQADKETGRYYPAAKGIQQILADYFDIDYDELMNEKDRMLLEIRVHHDQREIDKAA